ncbi:hypothetical protein COO60DRAFT_1020067 [Scenedesmus sp. NREL 46B-D3]|nr:hypothetical protein COO60DRAFT_1020067 [Scenedesmus sp. NREL 46B-D3]
MVLPLWRRCTLSACKSAATHPSLGGVFAAVHLHAYVCCAVAEACLITAAAASAAAAGHGRHERLPDGDAAEAAAAARAVRQRLRQRGGGAAAAAAAAAAWVRPPASLHGHRCRVCALPGSRRGGGAAAHPQRPGAGRTVGCAAGRARRRQAGHVCGHRGAAGARLRVGRRPRRRAAGGAAHRGARRRLAACACVTVERHRRWQCTVRLQCYSLCRVWRQVNAQLHALRCRQGMACKNGC